MVWRMLFYKPTYLLTYLSIPISAHVTITPNNTTYLLLFTYHATIQGKLAHRPQKLRLLLSFICSFHINIGRSGRYIETY
ncbi:hypothetical protein F4775DRAFT_580086 [Biscogniauxia sp. FL1348]|nr:hypothetical protein F4775DRAFT_580086 [Biscogniauxia sp. FL1348]